MTDLNSIFRYSDIENLGYDSVYTELPVPDIVDFSWRKSIPSPPKNIDKETIKELQFLSSLTKNRSQEQKELVYSIDQELDAPFIKLLSEYNIEYPENFIDIFYRIVRPILLNIKSLYNRPRPIQLAKLYGIDIHMILTDTIHTASYPSGHTVYSSLVANIIGYYYPQINSKKLQNIVDTTAKARMLQGVHYPSDNKGSLLLSKFLFDNLNSKLRKYANDQIQ